MLTSRRTAPEIQIACIGRFYRPSTRYPVIVAHGGDSGAGPYGDGLFSSSFSGDFTFVEALTRASYPIAYCDLAQNGFGNDSVISRVTDAVSMITSSPWSAKTGKVLLLGISAGTASVLNWARQNTASVLACACVAPALDMNDVYTNNKGGFRAPIGTAYGVTFPTALPAQTTHVAWQYPADVRGFPIKLFASDNDPLASDTTHCQTWAGSVGTNVSVESMGSIGHASWGLDRLKVVKFFDDQGGRL